MSDGPVKPEGGEPKDMVKKPTASQILLAMSTNSLWWLIIYFTPTLSAVNVNKNQEICLIFPHQGINPERKSAEKYYKTSVCTSIPLEDLRLLLKNGIALLMLLPNKKHASKPVCLNMTELFLYCDKNLISHFCFWNCNWDINTFFYLSRHSCYVKSH